MRSRSPRGGNGGSRAHLASSPPLRPFPSIDRPPTRTRAMARSLGALNANGALLSPAALCTPRVPRAVRRRVFQVGDATSTAAAAAASTASAAPIVTPSARAPSTATATTRGRFAPCWDAFRRTRVGGEPGTETMTQSESGSKASDTGATVVLVVGHGTATTAASVEGAMSAARASSPSEADCAEPVSKRHRACENQ